MRYNLFPILLLVCFLVSCKKNKEPDPIPNNKALKWTKSYGGNEYDFGNAVIQLSDGSYVFAGATRSTGAEFPGTRWGWDVWISKVDTAGTKQWYSIFGDNDDNYATGIAATADGGFILTGYTFLNNQNFAWVAKTSSTGTQQWQKSLSTSTDAKALSIIPTNDGNFLITGYSTASAGRDGWVAKISQDGTTIWNKTYGGTGEDQFSSAVKSSDGSFTLSGYTASANGDLTANKGSFDGWIMRIDASGNKVWSSTFGGSDEDYLKSVTLAADGGFVAAGYTKSSNGDITLNKGGYEEWIIKVDATGDKQWLKTYGGFNEEYVFSITPSREGGYITVGYTNSTTGDVVRGDNDFGAWLIKLDPSGNKIDASTYGRNPWDDMANAIIPTQDGGFLMVGNQWVDGKGYEGWLVKIDNF